MTTATANSTVVTAALITFASVSIDRVSDGKPPSGRQVAATCLAFAGLSLIAGPAPDIAGGLAICVGATAFATSGLPALTKTFGKGITQ